MSREPVVFNGNNYEVSSSEVDYDSNYKISTITETERGLLPNTRYAIRVRAFNSLGVSSEWSEALEVETTSDNTQPKQPQNLSLSTVDGHLTILWDDVTENTDNTPISDLAYYEVLLQDNIEYSGDLLPPFRYTSIANSYTFLYSANKAVHEALTPPQPPSEDWTVYVYAVDFSGNRSEPATNDKMLTFGAISVDFPVNFQSSDYDGTNVESHDATDGIKIQENGEMEVNDLRVNGVLKIQGHNIVKPPMIIGRRQTDTSIGNDSLSAVVLTTVLNNKIEIYDSTWNELEIAPYTVDFPGGYFELNIDGWYKITANHRWGINTTGSRQAWITLNSSLVDGTGGLNVPLGAHAGSFPPSPYQVNQFTDSVILELPEGTTIRPRVYQNSGGSLNLANFDFSIELVSY